MKKLFLILATIAYIAISCEKDKLINKTKLTLTTGDTFLLTYDGDGIWTSDQPLIASVDSTGIVTAERVGITRIRINQSTCNITVKPRYNTFTEPYLNLYAKPDDVKNVMKSLGFVLNHDFDDNDMLWSRSFSFKKDGFMGTWLFSYYDENYDFETNPSHGISAQEQNTSRHDEVINFLKERYIPIDYTIMPSNAKFFNIDSTMKIQCILRQYATSLYYFPIDQQGWMQND